MIANIVNINAQVDGRAYVKIDFMDDKNEVKLYSIEPLLDIGSIDVQVYAANLIPMVEAMLLKEQQEAQEEAQSQSARDKVELYLASFTDAELKTEIGLTDAELSAYKKDKGIDATDIIDVNP